MSMENGVIGLTEYQCCFCGEAVEPLGPDVGGLLYTTNIDGPVEKQNDQQLWCHAAHLKQHLHPSVPLYILDLVGDEDPQRELNMSLQDS